MELEGHIQNGHVILDSPTDLPDGTHVRIEVITPAPASDEKRFARTLQHRLDLPPDAAAQHDHYLYGTPKR